MIDSLNPETAKQQEMLEGLSEEKAEMQQAKGNLNQEKAEEQKVIDSLSLEKAELQQTLESVNQENAELHQAIDSLNKEKAEQQKMIDSLNLEKAGLQQVKDSSNREKAEQHQAIDRFLQLQETRESYGRIIEHLRQEQGGLQQIFTSEEEKHVKLRIDNAVLTTQLEERSKQLRQLDQERLSLKGELSDILQHVLSKSSLQVPSWDGECQAFHGEQADSSGSWQVVDSPKRKPVRRGVRGRRLKPGRADSIPDTAPGEYQD